MKRNALSAAASIEFIDAAGALIAASPASVQGDRLIAHALDNDAEDHAARVRVLDAAGVVLAEFAKTEVA